MLFILQELVTRSGLETNKLDLLAEISNLKLKLASIERDKQESEQRMINAQVCSDGDWLLYFVSSLSFS